MKTTTRNLLKWELRWIPIELAMIALGLFLLVGLHLDAGEYFLFIAVALSGAVRWSHYCSARTYTGSV